MRATRWCRKSRRSVERRAISSNIWISTPVVRPRGPLDGPEQRLDLLGDDTTGVHRLLQRVSLTFVALVRLAVHDAEPVRWSGAWTRARACERQIDK